MTGLTVLLLSCLWYVGTRLFAVLLAGLVGDGESVLPVLRPIFF